MTVTLNRSWKLTAAQRDEIARRFASGESPTGLAEEFGVSVTSVRSAAFRRGLKRDGALSPRPYRRTYKLSDEQYAELLARYEAGNETNRELAAAFGVTPGYVGLLVRRAGLPGHLVSILHPHAERILAERKRGDSLRAIAARYQVTAEGIRQFLVRRQTDPQKVINLSTRLKRRVETSHRIQRMYLTARQAGELLDRDEAEVIELCEAGELLAAACLDPEDDLWIIPRDSVSDWQALEATP
jgi:hypothetical protein